MAYAIWARVSGGVTGLRETWLKSGGKIETYDDEQVAKTRASELNKQMNNPNARASFSYTVRQYS